MHHQVSDIELYKAARAGHSPAFAELVRRYRQLVYTVANKLTNEPELSQDITQDTFLEAWRRLDNLRKPSALRYWLVGITRNKCRQALRRKLRAPASTSNPLSDDLSVTCDRPTPLESTLDRENRELLRHIMVNVPTTYKQPLCLFYIEDCTIKQIAKQLDLSVDAVKQRLTRGRRYLREHALGADIARDRSAVA